VDGFVCHDGPEFLQAALRLATDPALRARMGSAARGTAERASWDQVMEGVYNAYREALGRLCVAAIPV